MEGEVQNGLTKEAEKESETIGVNKEGEIEENKLQEEVSSGKIVEEEESVNPSNNNENVAHSEKVLENNNNDNDEKQSKRSSGSSEKKISKKRACSAEKEPQSVSKILQTITSNKKESVLEEVPVQVESIKQVALESLENLNNQDASNQKENNVAPGAKSLSSKKAFYKICPLCNGELDNTKSRIKTLACTHKFHEVRKSSFLANPKLIFIKK